MLITCEKWGWELFALILVAIQNKCTNYFHHPNAKEHVVQYYFPIHIIYRFFNCYRRSHLSCLNHFVKSTDRFVLRTGHFSFLN